MNTQIRGMLSDAEGRYLEPTEQSMLKEFAESLDTRLEVMRAIQAKEGSMIEAAVEEVLEHHADAVEHHEDFEDKMRRDMTLVLRYCTMAMVREDESFLEEKLLHWFRTIIEAYEMTEYADTAYGTLLEAAADELDEDHYQVVRPYLETSHEILSGET